MSRSILSPVLTLNSYNRLFQDHVFDFPRGYGGRGSDIANTLIKWFVCRSRLRRIFDIPKEATKIQFRAYSEPGPGRTKMKFIVVNDYWSVPDKLVCIDGHEDEIMVEDTFDSIKTLGKGRKTWYVNVYYWEED